MYKYHKQHRVNDLINSSNDNKAILKRLLAYERELIKLDSEDNMKAIDNLPDYDEDFKKIYKELGL
jgi:hypothetical protein